MSYLNSNTNNAISTGVPSATNSVPTTIGADTMIRIQQILQEIKQLQQQQGQGSSVEQMATMVKLNSLQNELTQLLQAQGQGQLQVQSELAQLLPVQGQLQVQSELA